MPLPSCIPASRRRRKEARADSLGRWTMTGTVDVKAFLEQLNRARADGRAKVEIDFHRVTDPRCPLPFEAFKGRIAYLYLGIIIATLVAAKWAFQANWTDTLIAAAAVSLVYWIVGKRFLERWTTGKIVDKVTTDGDAWEKIWKWGGITLKVPKGETEAAWVAPKDRWRDAYESLQG